MFVTALNTPNNTLSWEYAQQYLQWERIFTSHMESLGQQIVREHCIEALRKNHAYIHTINMMEHLNEERNLHSNLTYSHKVLELLEASANTAFDACAPNGPIDIA